MSQRGRRVRVIVAWTLLFGSVICWPLSQILGWDKLVVTWVLSWLAIILASAELLTSSQVHEEQGEGKT